MEGELDSNLYEQTYLFTWSLSYGVRCMRCAGGCATQEGCTRTLMSRANKAEKLLRQVRASRKRQARRTLNRNLQSD